MKSFETFIGDHRQEMINALRTLVEYPSVRGASLSGAPFGQPTADALRAFLAIAEKAGLRTRNLDGYAGVAEWGGDPALGILSHLDVVPAGDGWTMPPFKLTEKDGVLYGRGVIDDKGPTVAALFALRAVIECGVPLKRGVRLIVGCSEETGGEDMDYYAAREAFPPMVFTPDSDFPAVCIEKGRAYPALTATFDKADAPCAVTIITADGVVNAVPGVATARIRGLDADTLRPLAEAFSADPAHPAITLTPDGDEVEVTATGAGAHASTPDRGVNALTGLLAWLTSLPLTPTPAFHALCALSRLFPAGESDGAAVGLACSDESGELTLVLSRLAFSETELVAEGDCRFPLCRTLRQVTDTLTAAAEKSGFAARIPGVEPHHVPADSPFVRTLLDVYEQVTGERGCQPLAIGGGTYVHDIPNGVAFGAQFSGEDNHMHGADEFVTLERLEQTTLIYAHAIARLCGPADGDTRTK